IARSASTASPGTTTPPSSAEWLTSSWRPRKYQGALAGLGVFAGLANSSRGACQKIETAITVATVSSKATPSRKKAYGGKDGVFFLLHAHGLEDGFTGYHLHQAIGLVLDRKSTRLNSSHLGISYAVFC